MDEANLRERAKRIRKNIVRMLSISGSGHSGGPLGSADFWTALYLGGVINYRVNEPDWENRDRVIVSAGHYAPVVYATLAEAGFFPEEELWTLRRLGSRLQGHPVKGSLPGIETSSGPLGQGVSVAVGMALAARLDKKKWRVICFMGDGEQNEGQVWEAYMLAGKEKLSNLLVVIDRNEIQVDGDTEEVLPLEPLVAKLQAFNLEVVEIDGHNVSKIVEELRRGSYRSEKPTVMILKTVPGKGVSFMEGKFVWHGKVPDAEETKLALAELSK